MQGYEVTQSSTAYPLIFLLISSTDHITGLTGASPTVTLSKNGGAFASPSGAVSEIGNGWYKVAGNATDTNTLGPIALHATASGGDPTDVMFPVVAINPQSATAFVTGVNSLAPPTNWNLESIDSSGRVLLQPTQTGVTIPIVTTVTNQLTVAAIATGIWQDTTAGDFTTAGSIGKALYINAVPGATGGHFIAGTNAATTITTSLTTTFTGNVTGSVGSVTGNVGGNVTGSVGSVTGNVGGNVVGSVASVTAAVTISTAQVLGTPRALDTVADGSMQINDALWAAIVAGVGQHNASSGTTMTVKTPSTGTILRTYTLTTVAGSPASYVTVAV